MDAAARNNNMAGVGTAKVLPPAQKPSALAVEFEGVFLSQVVNEMLKSSAPKTMNGGHGEEMFQSFLGNEIGMIMAKTGGVGIAQSVDRALEAYKK